MTIEEIRSLDAPTITPDQAAEAIGTTAPSIRWQAKHEPEALGFPVIVVKSRVKIPRLPFLRFMGVGV